MLLLVCTRALGGVPDLDADAQAHHASEGQPLLIEHMHTLGDEDDAGHRHVQCHNGCADTPIAFVAPFTLTSDPSRIALSSVSTASFSLPTSGPFRPPRS
jgi:hypothetical protein